MNSNLFVRYDDVFNVSSSSFQSSCQSCLLSCLVNGCPWLTWYIFLGKFKSLRRCWRKFQFQFQFLARCCSSQAESLWAGWLTKVASSAVRRSVRSMPSDPFIRIQRKMFNTRISAKVACSRLHGQLQSCIQIWEPGLKHNHSKCHRFSKSPASRPKILMAFGQLRSRESEKPKNPNAVGSTLSRWR